MRRPNVATAVALLLAVLFAGWSYAALHTGLLAALDARQRGATVAVTSPWGQVMAAWSFVTHPVVTYGVVIVLGVWAFRRRLRNLAFALGLSVPFGWAGGHLLKELLRRPRPPGGADLITSGGFAYPSGHVTGLMTLLVMGLAVAMVTRRAPSLVWSLRALGVALLASVAYNRWVLQVHWVTDLVGGALFGGLAAATALALAGVHVIHVPLGPPPERIDRVAVIVNPSKIGDWEVFRRHVEGAVRAHGAGMPLWLETRVDDPGRAATKIAIKREVDLVMVAGGDGTVRTVCGRLAGSGIPLGILPAGTGNLLARNLGIPLDLDDALDVALEGRTQNLDLVRIRADGGRPQPSVVMAGMGIDAVIMSQTNPELKKAVGTAAYVTAAVAALNRPPFSVQVTLDDGEEFTRHAGLALVANVGQLMAGITMVPDARADDGRLDVLIASPRNPADWAQMATRVIGRLPDPSGIDRAQTATVVFETTEPVAYQIDGDTEGECTRLEARIRPARLLVRTP